MTRELDQQSQRSFTLFGGVLNRGGRVIWALEELEAKYELKDLKLFQGEHKHPAFTQINPKAKVPALIIHHPTEGDEILTESLAILYTLAQRSPEALLWPNEIKTQSKCHEWLAFAATELEPPLWIHAKHSFVYPERRRVPEIFSSCEYDYQKALDHLELALNTRTTEWVCADHFTIADLYIAHTLMWGATRSLGTIGASTQAYLQQIKARPAWQRVFIKPKNEPTP